jgi:hypothetical protein
MVNNYELCIKKVPVLQKQKGKEERKERKDTALPMSLLQQTVSKQAKSSKT